MRKLGAVAIALIAMLGLSACHQYLPEPLSFTVVDGQPVVRTCVALTVTSQAIYLYDSEEDYKGHTVWVANAGKVDVPSGTEFVLGEAIPGLTASETSEDWRSSHRVKFEMDVTHAKGGSWTTYAAVDPSALKEGEWTDSDGEVQESPCTHEKCSAGATCMNNWPEPTGHERDLEPTLKPSANPAR